MKQFIILLLILFVLVIAYETYSITEEFQEQAMDPTTVSNYKTFLEFYHPFLTNWEKGISTMIALQQPQPEPTTTQKEPVASSSPPLPSRNEINIKIGEISRETGTSYPPLTDPLPATLTSETLPMIAQNIPKDPTPYINAYRWMNSNLEQSHRELDKSLNRSSEGFLSEAFAGTCEQVQQCTNDPAFIAKVTQAQQQQQQQTLMQQQQQLLPILKRFNTSATLRYEIMKNKALMAKSEKIKGQAQSGELLNQYQSNEPAIHYELPAGSDLWDKMNQDDPNKVEQLKNSSNTSWLVNFANWRNSVNRNLR